MILSMNILQYLTLIGMHLILLQKIPGVQAFVTAKNIPGKNCIVELSEVELVSNCF